MMGIDPMGFNKFFLKPQLENLGIIEINFQIVNKSRSRLFDITYSADGATFNTRKGSQTFFGFFNPTSMFLHRSLPATHGISTVKLMMFAMDTRKEDLALVRLHINTEWKYENVIKQDTIEVSFRKSNSSLKKISDKSKFIYKFEHTEKHTYVLTVMNTVNQKLAHEAGVLCESGEAEFKAKPKALERAVSNYFAARGKIRSVDQQSKGDLLEKRITEGSKEAFKEFAKKLMKNHIEEMNKCMQFKNKESDEDCDKKLGDSLQKFRKALDKAIELGEPNDSYFCEAHALAKEAFDSWISAQRALEQFQTYKNIGHNICEDEACRQIESYGKTAKDKFRNALSKLQEVPKVWPGFDLMFADHLYEKKLLSTEAEWEDYQNKLYVCLGEKKKETEKKMKE